MDVPLRLPPPAAIVSYYDHLLDENLQLEREEEEEGEEIEEGVVILLVGQQCRRTEECRACDGLCGAFDYFGCF